MLIENKELLEKKIEDAKDLLVKLKNKLEKKEDEFKEYREVSFEKWAKREAMIDADVERILAYKDHSQQEYKDLKKYYFNSVFRDDDQPLYNEIENIKQEIKLLEGSKKSKGSIEILQDALNSEKPNIRHKHEKVF